MKMRYVISCFFVLLLAAVPFDTEAKPSRSRAAVRAFLREQGLTATPPGYQVDHIIPLCAGGLDAPENMQFLSIEEHKAKTRIDVRWCRLLKKIEKISEEGGNGSFM